jgi:hypothetical protein
VRCSVDEAGADAAYVDVNAQAHFVGGQHLAGGAREQVENGTLSWPAEPDPYAITSVSTSMVRTSKRLLPCRHGPCRPAAVVEWSGTAARRLSRPFQVVVAGFRHRRVTGRDAGELPAPG